MNPGFEQFANQNDTPIYKRIAEFANVLLLIGAIIIVTTTDDNLIVLAAFVRLFAGFLFIRTAFLEASDQQIAPGRTTLANNLKISGSILAIIASLILVAALLIEVYLKGTTREAAVIPPFVAGVGAFTV